MSTTTETAARTPFEGKCRGCGHQFVLAYLPMPVAKVAAIVKAAHCPMCGAGSTQLGICHTGETADVIMSAVRARGAVVVSDTANIEAWFREGERGLSSETMARTALGARLKDGPRHPLDPDDLRRCMLLVEQAPEVREAFPQIAALNKTWARLIEHWDELVALLREEIILGYRAPKTYARMRELVGDRW